MEKRAQSFDICIVCALYEEAEAVLNEFSTRCHVSFLKDFSSMDRYEYRYASILNNQRESLTVLVTWLSDSGPTQTGLDLKPLLHEFCPRFVAMTGICAGYKKKVKWGDLVVAQYAYFYEAGKVVSEADGLSRHLQEMKVAASTSQVLHYARGFDGWREPVREMKSDRLKRQLKETEEPRCIIAPIASGMAVRQDDPFLWLREYYDRNTVGLDMEAATFYQALRAVSHIHGLVVKGVCDHADMNKKDTYHDYAARASAVYLLSFIQEYVNEYTMPRRDALPSPNEAGPSGVWNVPQARNPHFTGRSELLDRLHQQLTLTGHSASATTRRVALTQPLAIKGLGGIGKTQVAVEYAYRSREQGYYTHTLWVNAASEETIITSFVTIAQLLPSFSPRNEKDQRKLVEAVKRWLELCEQQWLLIFDNVDNADNLPIIQQYLPQRGNGSVLITTRANAVGSLAASIEVEIMGLMEGTQFLLHRAQRLDHISDEAINEATNVVIALDYFPLALDQAGAYIEETGCSFTDYLHIYQTHRKELLLRRGLQARDYPSSVATTWSLSFQKVEQAAPAAAELLRLCAFLAPDNIPEELITNSASDWPKSLRDAARDRYTLNQTIEELLKFSLVKRFAETQTLSIHRLVQAVQIDMMEPEVRHQWAEKIVRAVNRMFPDHPQDMAAWPQCLRYLDQAQECCDKLINEYELLLSEAADLLHRTGFYLSERASYTLAEQLYQRASRIRELATAQINHSRAYNLYRDGKFQEAERLQKHALAMRERFLEPDHLDMARSLHNLALIYHKQGKFQGAEPLYQQALAIFRHRLGDKHEETAMNRTNLSVLYRERGKFQEAEPLLLQALTIFEQQPEPDPRERARHLNSLAGLYFAQGKYEQAEPFYRQVLAIRELNPRVGPDHPETATALNNLAGLYTIQGRYDQAEPLLQRALAIDEKAYKHEHPDVAMDLNNLAELYKRQGKYQEAEPLYQRALIIRESCFSGTAHPDIARSLGGLAELYTLQGKYEQAEPLYQRALAIQEQLVGPTHPETRETQRAYAALLRLLRCNEETEKQEDDS